MKKIKGVSIAEVIVAMALVVILSLIALSTVNWSFSTGRKEILKTFFNIESRNYITAYYSGASNYQNAMNLITNGTYIYGQDATIYYSSDLVITEEENSMYYVNLDFNTNSFSVKCYTSQNTLLYEVVVWYENK